MSPAVVTAYRCGPEPSPAGPLAIRTVPSGCQALPASVNFGGVTSARVPSSRFRISMPRGVSSAIRIPSGENDAKVQESRIVLTSKRSAAGRQ